jgi:hypothetical protein
MSEYHDLYKPDKKTKMARRLQKLAKAWQKKTEAPLDKRQKLLRLWASGFFDMGYSREHLVNLVDRGVFTIVPYLVEGNPKIMVESLVGNFRTWAYTTQLALNFLIDKMKLADSVFIPAAINSMFGAGIVRTFTQYDRQVSIDNEVIKSGIPTIRVIDDSDYVGDVSAKTRDDFVFEGDIYKLPTLYAKDLFSKHADLIMPDCKLVSEYSPDKVSHGEFDINRLSLREYSTFMDVYLKDEGVTVTIMPEGKKAIILRTVEEDGPGESPYDFLGYKYFPGSTYPIPPAWSWHDLDVTMNVLAKTAREQAESQKDLIFLEPSHKDLAKKILNAKNLDVMEAMNPKEGINHISMGGVNDQNYLWMSFAEQQFTKSGANPDIMRGAEAQAPTLGQEKMLFANASRIVNNMYTRWHEFMTSVIHKLAWKVWTDPTVYIPLIHEIPGVAQVPKVFSQADKVGDFYDFIFKLIPYSSQRKSPEMRYQEMMGFMAQWVLPTYQFAAQQGAELDVPAATRIMADYLGIDNFNQWYCTAIPHELQGVGYQMQPMGGPVRAKGEQRTNAFGQQNDSAGANETSRVSNLMQQQSRTTAQGEA